MSAFALPHRSLANTGPPHAPRRLGLTAVPSPPYGDHVGISSSVRQVTCGARWSAQRIINLCVSQQPEPCLLAPGITPGITPGNNSTRGPGIFSNLNGRHPQLNLLTP